MLKFKEREDKKLRYDAAEERWMPMEIRGVRGYFNDLRIDRGTVPEGFHLWELADADNDGFPCRYRRGILVNFYGTFITKGQLPVDDPEWVAGYIGSTEEWSWLGKKSMTLQEKEADLIRAIGRAGGSMPEPEDISVEEQKGARLPEMSGEIPQGALDFLDGF